MRIVQLGKYYHPHLGGIENNVRQVSLALAAEHEVTALVFNTASETIREKDGPVDVVRLRSYGQVKSQEMCPGIVRELRRLKPDIVHLHAPNPLSMMAYRWAMPRVPLVITHHTDMVRQKLLRHLFVPTYRRLLRTCARVIVYTRQYAEDCLELPGINRPFDIIPNGTAVPPYLGTEEFEAAARETRQRLSPDAPLLCFIGRFVEYKGLDYLVDAVAQVPRLRAVLMGDGPSRDAVRRRIADLGLGERIELVGPQSGRDKWQILQASDCLVLSSLNQTESFGQVLVEAQLCGKPTIVTQVRGGVTEVAPPGVTSLAVPPADAIALAAAIRNICSDLPLRQRLGDAGRARARALYTREVVDGRIRTLFNQVALRRTAAVAGLESIGEDLPDLARP